MNKDLRPQAKDMTLCLNIICQNKCKRYYGYWKPSQMQSYINPANEHDNNGNQRPCKARLEEI